MEPVTIKAIIVGDDCSGVTQKQLMLITESLVLGCYKSQALGGNKEKHFLLVVYDDAYMKLEGDEFTVNLRVKPISASLVNSIKTVIPIVHPNTKVREMEILHYESPLPEWQNVVLHAPRPIAFVCRAQPSADQNLPNHIANDHHTTSPN